jgi:hypothetical protein
MIPPAILGFGDIFGIAPPHHLKLADWAAISEIALAVFAFAALVGAVIQIRTARTSSRVEITYNYTERFSNLARDHLASFYELAHLPGASSGERLGAFLDWESKAQYDALTVPNLIEEIAGMYNRGLLHNKIIEDFFGVLACDLWKSSAWFIAEYRDHTSDRDFYRQWEKMLKRIGRAKEAGITRG